MKIGLALSGGGIKGAAHIGVLKALEEENIKISHLSGTSSGSIIATLHAVGYKPDEMLTIFKDYAKNIHYIDFRTILKLLTCLLRKKKLNLTGLNSGKSLEKIIEKVCKQKNITTINEISLPLIIPTVKLQDGNLAFFTSMESNFSIAKCVRASCSFPGIFEPVSYNGYQLIDGGLRENIPWKNLKSIGAKKVLCIAFEEIYDNKNYTNIIDILDRSINIVCDELENYELEKADLVLKIKINKISLLDHSKIDELYKLGYQQIKKNLAKIKILLQ